MALETENLPGSRKQVISLDCVTRHDKLDDHQITIINDGDFDSITICLGCDHHLTLIFLGMDLSLVSRLKNLPRMGHGLFGSL